MMSECNDMREEEEKGEGNENQSPPLSQLLFHCKLAIYEWKQYNQVINTWDGIMHMDAIPVSISL